MKFKAELCIELPDNATPLDVEDAKICAERRIEWHRVLEMKERMRQTDLTNKCGSCKYFVLKPDLSSCCYGICQQEGHKGYRTRTRPGCKKYERKNEGCTE